MSIRTLLYPSPARALIRRFIVALLPFSALAAFASVGHATDVDANQLAVPVSEMHWQDCPGTLPAGCEMAVLEGNPGTDGLFTVRFRVAAGFLVAAHTHPEDERVTVLSGRVAVAFGAGSTESEARAFGPGDYYVNAREAVHKVWVQEASEIQVTGFGPWVVSFIENVDE